MAKRDPRQLRQLNKIIIAMFLISAFALPLTIWGVRAFSEHPPPFREHAFSASIETTIVALFGALALATAISMIRRIPIAPFLGITYTGLLACHTIVETIITYPSKRPYPGPRMASFGQAALMLLCFIVMTWYFLRLYPRVTKDA